MSVHALHPTANDNVLLFSYLNYLDYFNYKLNKMLSEVEIYLVSGITVLLCCK